MTNQTSARHPLSINLTSEVQAALLAERERISRETGLRPSLNQIVLRALRSALLPAAAE